MKENKPLNPQTRQIGNVEMVNADWIKEKFGVETSAAVNYKMKVLNVAGVYFGQCKFYPLKRIEAALDRPLRRIPDTYR